jgi:hypothetical protein
MSPILGIIASSFRSAAGPDGAYDALATVTVPSGGLATITFAAIPNTYKHLQIRLIARSNESGNSADSLRLQFNSDTAANYSRHRLYGYSGTAYAGGASSTTFMQCADYPYGGTTANTFGGAVIDLLDYANTSKFKTMRALGGNETNDGTSSALSFYSGSWRNTNAITSITITPGGGSLVQHSQFTLYGIK